MRVLFKQRPVVVLYRFGEFGEKKPSQWSERKVLVSVMPKVGHRAVFFFHTFEEISLPDFPSVFCLSLFPIWPINSLTVLPENCWASTMHLKTQRWGYILNSVWSLFKPRTQTWVLGWGNFSKRPIVHILVSYRRKNKPAWPSRHFKRANPTRQGTIL